MYVHVSGSAGPALLGQTVHPICRVFPSMTIWTRAVQQQYLLHVSVVLRPKSTMQANCQLCQLCTANHTSTASKTADDHYQDTCSSALGMWLYAFAQATSVFALQHSRSCMHPLPGRINHYSSMLAFQCLISRCLLLIGCLEYLLAALSMSQHTPQHIPMKEQTFTALGTKPY